MNLKFWLLFSAMWYLSFVHNALHYYYYTWKFDNFGTWYFFILFEGKIGFKLGNLNSSKLPTLQYRLFNLREDLTRKLHKADLFILCTCNKNYRRSFLGSGCDPTRSLKKKHDVYESMLFYRM